MMHSKNNLSQAFDTRYIALNEQQKSAVDNIEGPVMVLAGPGTGKTQILSMRIANILLKTDTSAENILCLTYTNAGVLAMRDRLFQIIGHEAHKINIHTFHSLCAQWIQQYSDYFGESESVIADDFEILEIIQKIIGNVPTDNILVEKPNNINNKKHLERIGSTFKYFQKSNANIQDIEKATDQYIQDMDNSPDSYYVKNGKGFKVGDKKPDYFKNIKKLEYIKACALLYDQFIEMKESEGLMEFEDLLHDVVEQLEQNMDFILDLREKYLYILVDEFQDTNGIQRKVLEYLAPYEDQPNLFLVGDDDQSIYSFQGADITNFNWFQENYKGLLIVLIQNYRSTQNILDLASQLIQNNNERMVSQANGISKDLIAKGRFAKEDIKPILYQVNSDCQDEAWVANEIMDLIKKGTDPSEIAILVTKHKYLQKIRLFFIKKGIPFQMAKNMNILEMAPICQLRDVIALCGLNEKDDLEIWSNYFFRYLHLPIWKLNVQAIVSILKSNGLIQLGSENQDFISSLFHVGDSVELSAEDRVQFKKAISTLEGLRRKALFESMPAVLDAIISSIGLLESSLIKDDELETYNAVLTFHQWAMDKFQRNKIKNFHEFNEIINKQIELKSPINSKNILQKRAGVFLTTVHGSKGLEFEYVFLLKTNASEWESKKSSNPPFLNPITNPYKFGESSEIDEEIRRLYYVAITRAKKSFCTLYIKNDDKGKELKASKLIEEAYGDIAKSAGPPELNFDFEKEYIRLTLNNKEFDRKHFVDKEVVESRMKDYSWSTSAIDVYLSCPVRFYFEKLLRVPDSRALPSVYGNVIHRSLERFFKHCKRFADWEQFDLLENFFREEIGKMKYVFDATNFQNFADQGVKTLGAFWKKELPHWKKLENFQVEKNFTATYDGIKIKGLADRIDIHHQSIEIIDYKTGDLEKSFAKLPSFNNGEIEYGEKYGRQIAFYHLLASKESDYAGKKISGVLHGLKNVDEIKEIRVDVNEESQKAMLAILKEVDKNVRDSNFSKGCNDEECTWCNFVKTYGLDKDKL